MTESFDPDEDRRSPGLEISRPDFQYKDPTPPFVIKDLEGEAKPPAGEGTSDCSRKNQSSISQFESAEPNSVLISHLEPNRPDIANHERSDPLRPEHFRDGGPWEMSKSDKSKPENSVFVPLKPIAPQSSPADHDDAAAKAQHALALLEPKAKPSEGAPETPEVVPAKLSSPDALKAEPISPKIPQPPPAPHGLPEIKPFSPALSQYAIHSSQIHSSDDILRPLHTPDNTTTLPPIKTALRELSHVKEPAGRVNGSSPYALPPVTAASPPVIRTESVWDHQRAGPFVPSQVPPSPYSHLSPASTKDLSAVSSPASQSTYFRPSIKSDIPYLTYAHEVAHSTAKSPATSYPTPTDQTPTGPCERSSFNPNPQSNGAVATGAFKCRHPGCTAPPFQTQYLLNSHANVHSQDRPHFCPIEGCPRGIGGKGFKRKNEMIRHGLVHNSPGYVCPFCPDQQHKYPRPDNLQRHVRVHHVDKSKDDPALRQVLSQRPEGSARGRRRRTNA
ncbi:hypothetical protein BDV25DRAFT_54750 [Aspergillus avenaceus]|uniref:C2H2-type domain-containing protein n=1 Tax=Aspergillus avenaceus TaxID=36643 RepID=A0A5N6TIP1_ASPAV|nr:hypothetical protein BDV25DRAFT_54750 [Aspergillus avenaceus]